MLKRIGRKLEAKELSAEVIFLDEVLYAVSRGIVDEAAVCHLLETGKDREWILTGRYEEGRLWEAADYISCLLYTSRPN